MAAVIKIKRASEQIDIAIAGSQNRLNEGELYLIQAGTRLAVGTSSNTFQVLPNMADTQNVTGVKITGNTAGQTTPVNVTNNSSNAVAIGNNASVTGSGAGIAIGEGTSVSNGGLAVGTRKNNISVNSVAIGYMATPSPIGVAIGSNAFDETTSLAGIGNVALGANSQVLSSNIIDSDNIVSVGSETTQRRIINVKDAINMQDAATLNQIRPLFLDAKQNYWQDNIVVTKDGGRWLKLFGQAIDNNNPDHTIILNSGAPVFGENENVIAAMTSNTAPTPLVASASSQYTSGYAPWNAFSTYSSSKAGWQSTTAYQSGTGLPTSDPSYLQIDLGVQVQISGTVIFSNSSTAAAQTLPVNVTLAGSNDNVNFTNITTFNTNFTGGLEEVVKSHFLFATYRYFRWYVNQKAVNNITRCGIINAQLCAPTGYFINTMASNNTYTYLQINNG